MIDGRAPGVTTVVDPVGAVVLSADTANVDTVIVAGKVRKRDGRLTGDWESARRAVQAPSEHLQAALEEKKADAAAAAS
jgi:cytosine/adenosine deaminase-related metal-dependent hydrolase